MPVFSASSSIAASSVGIPTASPGARTDPAVMRLMRASSKLQQSVFAAVQKGARLRDRFCKFLAQQVGHKRFVPEPGKFAFGISRQSQTLRGFGSAHDGLEHLLAAHHYADRTPKLHRCNRSCHNFLTYA